jgi:hypothetical protein
VNGYLYNATASSAHLSIDYTPSIIPYHPDIAVPLEVSFIFPDLELLNNIDIATFCSRGNADDWLFYFSCTLDIS